MNNYKSYRTLVACLLVNNLAGIVSNFTLSLVVCSSKGIGLPGILFFIQYAVWCIKPRIPNSILLACIIVYNIIILYLINDIGVSHIRYKFFDVFYPSVFPWINVGLSLLLLIITSRRAWKQYLAAEGQQQRKPVSATDQIAGFLIFFIILVITAFYYFSYNFMSELRF